MRKQLKRLLVVLGLALAMNVGLWGAVLAQTVQNTASIHISISSADGTQTQTIVIPLGTDQWQPRCIAAPYDYQYQDTARSIVINKITGDNVTYFVADVQIRDVSGFQTALSGGKPYGGLELVSTMAARSKAVLAINGDDYGTQKYGTIIRNGSLIRANATTRNLLIVDQNGDMSVVADRKGENPKTMSQQLLADAVWQTFEFGPELVRNGEAIAFNRAFDVISTSSTRREPRTAIGQIGTLHYIIIIVDGRQDGYSAGMTLPELQQLFVQYGAQTAMNPGWRRFYGAVVSGAGYQPSGGRRGTLCVRHHLLLGGSGKYAEAFAWKRAARVYRGNRCVIHGCDRCIAPPSAGIPAAVSGHVCGTLRRRNGSGAGDHDCLRPSRRGGKHWVGGVLESKPGQCPA